MSPEELNRTIEFIIESQARLQAAQEQDRQDRIEFEKWSKGINSQIANLLDLQSQRLDRTDKLHEELVGEIREFRTEAIDLLNLILNRLPSRPPAA
jgi:hypothetical protein